MPFKITATFGSRTVQPKGPGPLELAVNAAKAIHRNIASVAKGRPFKVDDYEAQRRLDECMSCEHYKPINDRCLHKDCGCFLRVKTRLHAEHCPDAKW